MVVTVRGVFPVVLAALAVVLVVLLVLIVLAMTFGAELPNQS